MGACASRPKDLDAEEAPIPVEKVEEQNVLQDNNIEAVAETEAKTEEPQVDVSTPAREASETEEEPKIEIKPEIANKETSDEENKIATSDDVSVLLNEEVVVSGEETKDAPILL